MATLISTHGKVGRFFKKVDFFFQKRSLQGIFTSTENVEYNEK